MIKVFLVEDEVVIRNGIKNSIDWDREGYEFAGEASDGELAYPLILKTRPDILITDIKMPFMDGLELSEAIRKELPDIKILILSGYNDFDYAKKAIGIGITDYLLKPVSAEKLLEAIAEVAVIIEKERDDKELLRKYAQDMQENTEQEKHQFMTRLITEQLSMTEALNTGKRLGMDLSAQVYNFILFKTMNNSMDESKNEELVNAFVDIEKMLNGRSGVYYFRRGVEGWAFLCMAENKNEMEALIDRLHKDIEETMKKYPDMEYFGGIGIPVNRLRELRESFSEADKAFSNRFTAKPNQIVECAQIHGGHLVDEPEVKGFGTVEENRELIAKFLRNGTEEEVESFVEAYFERIPEDNIKSMMMRQYIMMDIYISIVSFGEGLQASGEDIQAECKEIKNVTENVKDEASMRRYVKELLHGMIRLRDRMSGRRYSDIIEAAKRYIAKNYMSDEISLNVVSQSVNMSPSYFSSIFSQEAGKTFVEYLTGVRMEKAKEMLMCSSKKTSEIGFDVGYKDSHYFSYIFKKTQGCSPKEYRTRRKA